jgi:hypothetical protein
MKKSEILKKETIAFCRKILENVENAQITDISITNISKEKDEETSKDP